MARSIRNWFRYTKVGMWHSNRKQGITLLSDKEYSKMTITKTIVIA